MPTRNPADLRGGRYRDPQSSVAGTAESRNMRNGKGLQDYLSDQYDPPANEPITQRLRFPYADVGNGAAPRDRGNRS